MSLQKRKNNYAAQILSRRSHPGKSLQLTALKGAVTMWEDKLWTTEQPRDEQLLYALVIESNINLSLLSCMFFSISPIHKSQKYNLLSDFHKETSVNLVTSKRPKSFFFLSMRVLP